jgi:hypothetical protein
MKKEAESGGCPLLKKKKKKGGYNNILEDYS